MQSKLKDFHLLWRMMSLGGVKRGAGLSKGIIESELKQTSLNENDQRIIVDLITRNNKEIESYLKENATKNVAFDIMKGLKKRGMQ